MEDMYTNGPAALVSPAQTQGQEARKVRLIQFEKVTEEPMVTLVFCHHHPPTPTPEDDLGQSVSSCEAEKPGRPSCREPWVGG